MTEGIDIKTRKTKKDRFRWVRRFFKTIIWSVIAIVLLTLGLLQATISILTPERLTPLVEKALTKSLNADASVKRVELTVWETFPDVTLEIDSLALNSRALSQLSDSVRQKLPANCDSLVSFKYFHGGIKLYALLAGDISLYDIQLHEPMVNLVKVDSTLANYDVVPPSAPDTVPDTTSTQLPKFIIDKFALIAAKPIRYFSLSDNIDVTANIKSTELKGNNAPKYKIDFQGDVSSPLLSLINRTKTSFIINGGVEWEQANPTKLAINDFIVGFDIVKTNIDGEFDFGDKLAVNKLSVGFDPFKYNDVVARIPKDYTSMLKGISTNAALHVDLELTKPYFPEIDTIPSGEITLRIPQCKFDYGNLNLDKFSADISATLNGKDLDKAVVDLKKVALDGMGVKCSFSSRISSIISDPFIDGVFNGKVDLKRLPPFIAQAIAGRMSGELNADTEFTLRQSHLNSNEFHNILLKGGVDLTNFRFNSADQLTNLYVRKAEFNLGTNESFVKDSHRADSLLTASLRVDTCSFWQDGYDVRLAGLKAGVGCSNVAKSTDASYINPIGGTINLERLNFVSQEDSMKVRLRDVKCLSALRRFKNSDKVPELVLNIDAGRAGATTKEIKVNLKESAIGLTAHLNPRRKMSSHTKSAYNKIIKENPGISNDSAYAMARRIGKGSKGRRRLNDSIAKETSTIDFGVDRSTRALLYRWDVKGSIKSKSARLFTPYFPIRNRLSNVDIEFTTDSVAFNNISYKMGRSDFKVKGAISNIKKALSNRNRQPLRMALILKSDTIDVNQISETVFAGAAYSESSTKSSFDISETEDEEAIDDAIEHQAETAQAGALLVPMNIDALLRVSAKNIIYGDILMHSLSGNVQIYRGALRFDELRASTDMGSVNLSALYSAPTKKDMNFGFGLKIKDCYIDRFLTLFPTMDSIMPMMRDLKGVINAELAATVDVDTTMNLVIPSLNAAINISGDNLVLLDEKTFRTVSKWLLFRNKKKNMIDHMSVELVVKDSELEIFPFEFNIDRYKLGIFGYHDLAMNFNYHVSVLKSIIPFKFGINISGNPDKIKVRLGGAKYKNKMAAERIKIATNTRINLLEQIEGVFRRGIDRSSHLKLIETTEKLERIDENETLSHADSLLYMKEGLIPTPPTPPMPKIDSIKINIPSQYKTSKKK